MTNYQKRFLLNHLCDLDKEIAELKGNLADSADCDDPLSVGYSASIAAKLTATYAKRRAVCFTLSHLGYYVVYKDGHAEDIVLNSET